MILTHSNYEFLLILVQNVIHVASKASPLTTVIVTLSPAGFVVPPQIYSTCHRAFAQHFLNGYLPGYDILMGVCQTTYYFPTPTGATTLYTSGVCLKQIQGRLPHYNSSSHSLAFASVHWGVGTLSLSIGVGVGSLDAVAIRMLWQHFPQVSLHVDGHRDVQLMVLHYLLDNDFPPSLRC